MKLLNNFKFALYEIAAGYQFSSEQEHFSFGFLPLYLAINKLLLRFYLKRHCDPYEIQVFYNVKNFTL